MQLTAAEVQSLKPFAEGENDLPGMMAQNLLCFGYGICAVHYANSGGSFMRMATTKSFGQAMLAINKLEVLPNPASAFATFSYRFPLLKGKAIVCISDITGKIVDRINILNTEGQLIWDTRIIENGIYLYQVKDD